MATLLRHFYSPKATQTLCGVPREEDDQAWSKANEREQFNAPPCLPCDRKVRDNYRASNGLPPLTDQEFVKIHGRRAGLVLVVSGAQLG